MRLLLGEVTPSVRCPLAPGTSGRGLLGIRAQEVHLASECTDGLMVRLTFRTYLGGAFEVRVSVGQHVIPLVTTAPVQEGETIGLTLGRVHFFLERQ